jgi:hypothetical protein
MIAGGKNNHALREGTEKVPLFKKSLKYRLNKGLILFDFFFLHKFDFLTSQGFTIMKKSINTTVYALFWFLSFFTFKGLFQCPRFEMLFLFMTS